MSAWCAFQMDCLVYQMKWVPVWMRIIGSLSWARAGVSGRAVAARANTARRRRMFFMGVAFFAFSGNAGENEPECHTKAFAIKGETSRLNARLKNFKNFPCAF